MIGYASARRGGGGDLADLTKEGPSGATGNVVPFSGMMPINEGAVVAKAPYVAPVEPGGFNSGRVHPLPPALVAHVRRANPEGLCVPINPLCQFQLIGSLQICKMHSVFHAEIGCHSP